MRHKLSKYGKYIYVPYAQIKILLKWRMNLVAQDCLLLVVKGFIASVKNTNNAETQQAYENIIQAHEKTYWSFYDERRV